MELTDRLQRNQYYIICAVTSLFALFFLPLAGSEAGLGWNLPDTPAGWVVFCTTRILVAGINMLIFHCFVQQGKVNISKNQKYLDALRKMDGANSPDIRSPRTPSEYYKEVYGKKGVAIFATSLLSSLALTQAVLTFDWMSFITYLFTITLGVIFGILQMKDSEQFWTEEFPRLAEKLKGESHNDL